MGRKLLIAAGIVVFTGVLFAAYLFLFPPGPDLTKYEFLKTPRITNLPDQKMVEVRAVGDPNSVGKEAFGLLFKTYFKLKSSTKGMDMVAPRARWPKPLTTPKTDWTGIYGMPLPQAVTSLPEQEGPLKATLAVWTYGDVAEILHVGSYSTESPTVDRLTAFVQQQGYEIIGEHEEEYLKGPGMFFAGDPKGYHTIIRYRVAKTRAAGGK